jgi:hypothetical protein
MRILVAFCFILITINNIDCQVVKDKIIKKDKSSVLGKILRVTSENVEIDPEGEIPFLLIKRKEISFLIYSDNTVVDMNEANSAITEVNSVNDTKDPSYIILNQWKVRTDGVYWGKVESMKKKLYTTVVLRFLDKEKVGINTEFWMFVIEGQGKEDVNSTYIEANRDLYGDTWIKKLNSSGYSVTNSSGECHVSNSCFYSNDIGTNSNSINCALEAILTWGPPPEGIYKDTPILKKTDSWLRSKPVIYQYYVTLNPNDEIVTTLTGRYYKFVESALRKVDSEGFVNLKFQPLNFSSK